MYFNDVDLHLQNTVKFMGKPIEYVDSTDLLGVSVTRRNSERNVIVGSIVFYMILKIYHVMLKLNCLTLIV